MNAATTVAQLSDALESFADRLFAQRHLLSEAADEAAEQPDADGGEGGEGAAASARERTRTRRRRSSASGDDGCGRVRRSPRCRSA